MAKRRKVEVFSLSFLDVICCGFGAVILFYTIVSAQSGIERVRKIVQDLKNFSRAGDTDWQWADLAQGLESTINMVWNQIKYKAELRREYQPLPQVYCVASPPLA